MTLDELRNQVRREADIENDQHITDDELTQYVNDSAAELYDLLIQAFGDNYYVAPPVTFQTTSSTTYPLPVDFLKLLGVDISATGAEDTWVTVHPFTVGERNNFSFGPFQPYPPGVSAVRRQLRGNSIWFEPMPQGGQWIRLLYIPRCPALVNPGDDFDGINGWQEYVVVDAVLKCKGKREEDPGLFLARKTALIARIQRASNHRDAGAPKKIARTRQLREGSFPGGFGWGGWWPGV